MTGKGRSAPSDIGKEERLSERAGYRLQLAWSHKAAANARASGTRCADTLTEADRGDGPAFVAEGGWCR